MLRVFKILSLYWRFSVRGRMLGVFKYAPGLFYICNRFCLWFELSVKVGVKVKCKCLLLKSVGNEYVRKNLKL